MEQQRELRNGIVSALESSVSTMVALESNRVLYIVYRRRDWHDFAHSLHDYIGIFQSMSSDRANNLALLRNLLK